MSGAVVLDRMQPGDLPAVACIESAQHLTPWPESGFADALRQGWHAYVLRQTDAPAARVLGYVVAMTAGADEELLTITVAPGLEGRGFGRRLLAALLQDAQARGAERLFLEVRQSNRRAIDLYETAGFTMTGMRKNYYSIPANPAMARVAGREDAVLMMCRLRESMS